MARRPIDYTAQMQATEERRRLQEAKQREEAERERELLDRQARSYGELVIAFFGRSLPIDALAGLLDNYRERLAANPQLKQEWATRGAAYFQPAATRGRRGTKSEGATGKERTETGTDHRHQARHNRHADIQNEESSNGGGGGQNGYAAADAPVLPASRHGAAAAPVTPDLLNGLATYQPDQSPAAEGGGDGGHP